MLKCTISRFCDTDHLQRTCGPFFYNIPQKRQVSVQARLLKCIRAGVRDVQSFPGISNDCDHYKTSFQFSWGSNISQIISVLVILHSNIQWSLLCNSGRFCVIFKRLFHAFHIVGILVELHWYIDRPFHLSKDLPWYQHANYMDWGVFCEVLGRER